MVMVFMIIQVYCHLICQPSCFDLIMSLSQTRYFTSAVMPIFINVHTFALCAYIWQIHWNLTWFSSDHILISMKGAYRGNSSGHLGVETLSSQAPIIRGSYTRQKKGYGGSVDANTLQMLEEKTDIFCLLSFIIHNTKPVGHQVSLGSNELMSLLLIFLVEVYQQFNFFVHVLFCSCRILLVWSSQCCFQEILVQYCLLCSSCIQFHLQTCFWFCLFYLLVFSCHFLLESTLYSVMDLGVLLALHVSMLCGILRP